MVIQNSIVSISFPKIENIKRKYVLNEEILKDKFNEATILPIPEEIPNEIPRILITSQGEHSQVSISPNTINFQTEYTNGYEKDWEKCKNYIGSRAEDIFRLANQLTNNCYNYTGVIVNLIWDEIEQDANKRLFYNLLRKQAIDNLEDINVKFTYIEKEQYYVNISLQNVRNYVGFNPEIAGTCHKDKLDLHTVSVTIDINDRYSFHIRENYLSSEQKFKEILSLMTSTINNKLRNLIEKGEYK